MGRRRLALVGAVVFCLAFGPVADAAMVQKMDLGEVCSRAANIFRGTVLSEVPGTVEAGGATLPTVTYTVKVSEAFQGDFQTKGDQQYAEITMLGSVKPVRSAANALFRRSPICLGSTSARTIS